jgi:hypothetical protein
MKTSGWWLSLLGVMTTLSCGESGTGTHAPVAAGGEESAGSSSLNGGADSIGPGAGMSGNVPLAGSAAEAGAPGAAGPLDPAGDDDGDGLDNQTERDLALDPASWDSDDDGFSDPDEVGDAMAPTDTDADGIIDALESDLSDNDQDGTSDSTDPAIGWQVAAGRFYPHAIANDGKDATRIEVVITGSGVTRAALQSPAGFYDKTVLPNELEVDGKALGNAELELFDDGTHGDRFARDGIWTRGGITTHQTIRCATGERDWVVFLKLLTHDGDGAHERYLGIPAPDAPAGPMVQRTMGFYLGIVDGASLSKAKSLSATMRRTPHLLNIVAPEAAVAVKRKFIDAVPGGDPSVPPFFRPVLEEIPGDPDFVVVFPETAARGQLAGAYMRASVDAAGTGLPTYASSPAWGAESARFKGGIILDYRLFVPLNHEIVHHWGVYLSKDLGFGFEGAHWGVTSTFGVLGGFDPKTFVDNQDGTYSIGFFELAGNDWTTTPLSPLELYLAGLAPAAEVAPIISMQDAVPVKRTETAVIVTGTKKTTTIEQIVATHGARVPAYPDAPKAFTLAYVVYSQQPLTDAEMSWLDLQADFFGRKVLAGSMSFFEATNGRATADTTLPKLLSE